MTIQAAIKKYYKIEIELLLAHMLKKSKEFIFLHPRQKLTPTQAAKLTRMIIRRQKDEPVAYILGYKDFWSLPFKVNKNVLIPRPETEWLVEYVVHALGLPNHQMRPKQVTGRHYKTQKAINILDLGTGSGCIIISIARALQTTGTVALRNGARCYEFHASDISKKALSIAKFNAKKHGVKIKFYQSNLFSSLKGKFDIIVANLPYVPKKNYESKIGNLEWEPKQALVDPIKDFDLYQKFFQQAWTHIQKGSIIYLEIDPLAKGLIKKWTKKYLPQADIKFFKDFNNFWRYAEINV